MLRFAPNHHETPAIREYIIAWRVRSGIMHIVAFNHDLRRSDHKGIGANGDSEEAPAVTVEQFVAYRRPYRLGATIY